MLPEQVVRPLVVLATREGAAGERAGGERVSGIEVIVVLVGARPLTCAPLSFPSRVSVMGRRKFFVDVMRLRSVIAGRDSPLSSAYSSWLPWRRGEGARRGEIVQREEAPRGRERARGGEGLRRSSAKRQGAEQGEGRHSP